MRAYDWPQRLEDYVESCRATPFQWGTHDCCRFAAGAVHAMTEVDPMAAYRYANEIGARRLIRKAGSLDALVHRVLGDPLPTVAAAGRGDVVIADLDLGPTVGVALGGVAAFAAPVGLLFIPTNQARVAWRID